MPPTVPDAGRGGLGLQGIAKRFGPTTVVEGVDLTVAPGEFAVIVGPSGCGKSTLLRLVAGLEAPSAGRIVIGGRDVTGVPPAKRGMAMVFQSYALYPHMSVAQNMGFGLKIQGLPKAEIATRVARAARILQLETLLERKPRALSGGQRQRVAIGRAIVRDPEIFLFDEPLSNLDAALRGQMRVEIARLHAELGATMIYVTHDQVEAMTLATTIVVLNAGRVEQVGAPLALYQRPANLFVAGFLGAPRMNFLPGRLTSQPAGTLSITVGAATVRVPRAEGPRAGTSATLGVRPEHFALVEPDGGVLRGTVTLVERLGSESLVYVRAQDGVAELASLTLRLEGDARAARGDMVGLAFDPARCHLFGEDGVAVGHPPSQEGSSARASVRGVV